MTGRGQQDCSAGGRPLDLATASDGDLLALMGRKENTDLARAAWGAFYSRHVTFSTAYAVGLTVVASARMGSKTWSLRRFVESIHMVHQRIRATCSKALRFSSGAFRVG